MKVRASDFESLSEWNVETIIIQGMIDKRRSLFIDVIEESYVRDLISRGFDLKKIYEHEDKHVGYIVRW